MSVHLRQESLVVTSKAHTCSWCADPIPEISLAYYRSRIFRVDNIVRFYSEHMHTECSDAMFSEGGDTLPSGYA